MRRLLSGFFQVADPALVPEGCFVWAMEWGVLDTWDAGTLGNRRLVLQLDPGSEQLADAGAMREYLHAVDAKLSVRGLRPYAVACGEEWYTGQTKSWAVWDGATGWGWKDAVKVTIDQALLLIKRQWPHAYTVQIEPWFNDYKPFGTGYYAPAYNCDVLALDTFLYTTGDPFWGTTGLDLTPAAPYLKFELEVGRIYRHVAQYYRRPILMIPQAFHDPQAQAFWKVAPTAAQLRWWYGLAQQLPEVVAIGWFARQSLVPAVAGLDQHPELLAEVRTELIEIGVQ